MDNGKLVQEIITNTKNIANAVIEMNKAGQAYHYNVCDYDVVLDQLFMLNQDFSIASTFKPDGSDKCVIVVDCIWVSLPENYRRVFISHEVGHIKNNHLDNPLQRLDNNPVKRRISEIKLGHIQPAEIVADTHAVIECGKDTVINAFKLINDINLEIVRHLDSSNAKLKNQLIMSIREVSDRINYIESNF